MVSRKASEAAILLFVFEKKRAEAGIGNEDEIGARNDRAPEERADRGVYVEPRAERARPRKNGAAKDAMIRARIATMTEKPISGKDRGFVPE